MITSTVIDVEKVNNQGLKRVTAILLLDDNYPLSGYDITPSMFNLNSFKPTSSLTGIIDPIAYGPVSLSPTEVGVQALVAAVRIQGLKLRLSHMVGSGIGGGVSGGNFCELNSVSGTVSSGITAATACDAATPTVSLDSGGIESGDGYDFPNGFNCTDMIIKVTALGY